MQTFEIQTDSISKECVTSWVLSAAGKSWEVDIGAIHLPFPNGERFLKLKTLQGKNPVLTCYPVRSMGWQVPHPNKVKTLSHSNNRCPTLYFHLMFL